MMLLTKKLRCLRVLNESGMSPVSLVPKRACMDRTILHLRKKTADTFERAKVKEKFSYRHSISREFAQLSRISVF